MFVVTTLVIVRSNDFSRSKSRFAITTSWQLTKVFVGWVKRCGTQHYNNPVMAETGLDEERLVEALAPGKSKIQSIF